MSDFPAALQARQDRNRTKMATPGPASDRSIHKAIVLIVLVGLVAYANAFNQPFHYDDYFWIVDSANIDDLGTYVRSMANRPLFAATLALNYRIHGLDV